MKTIYLLVLSVLFSLNLHCQGTFSNDVAFLAYLKINKIPLTTNECEKFLKRYYADEIQKNATDEFEYKAYINKRYKSVKAQLDTFNINSIYIHGLMIRLGEYDFEKEGFPIFLGDDFSQGNINPKDSYTSYDYIAKAENIDDYKFLPMSSDSAKNLLSQLRLNGNRSRSLLALFYIKFTGETKKYVQDISNSFTGYVFCRLEEMHIHVKNLGMINLKK